MKERIMTDIAITVVIVALVLGFASWAFTGPVAAKPVQDKHVHFATLAIRG